MEDATIKDGCCCCEKVGESGENGRDFCDDDVRAVVDMLERGGRSIPCRRLRGINQPMPGVLLGYRRRLLRGFPGRVDAMDAFIPRASAHS